MDDELPWATLNKGLPMTPHQLAKRLSDYGIKSGTIRVGVNTLKGFKLEQFTEVFNRYLSGEAKLKQ